MRTPLSLVVLLLCARASAQAPQPAEGTSRQTWNCSVGPEGASSRDCERDMKEIFNGLARYAGVPNMEYVHVPAMYGVALECDYAGGQVRAKDSLSPAASIDCDRGKSYVATGYSLFSMAARCDGEGIRADPYDVVAAALAHEIAHIAAGHSARRIANIKRICGPWADAWIATPEADAMISPLIAGKPPKEARAIAITKVLEVCMEKKRDDIARSQVPLEQEADANAGVLIRNHAAGEARSGRRTFSHAAMECAMKGLQDLDWATAVGATPSGPHVSDHPASRDRVEAARRQRLTFTAMEICATGPPDAMCVNRYVAAQRANP